MKSRFLARIVFLSLLLPLLMMSEASAILKVSKPDVSKISPQEFKAVDNLRFHPTDFTKLTGLKFENYIPWVFYVKSTTNLNIRKDSGEFHNYVKMDKVDWHHPDQAKVKFGWKTGDVNYTSAACQVSLIRFSPDPRLWKKPYGLVHENKIAIVPTEQDQCVFYVDFYEFAPKPPLNIALVGNITTKSDTNLIRRNIIKPDDSAKPKVTKKEKPGTTVNKPVERKEINLQADADKYRLTKKIKFSPPQITLFHYYIRVILFDQNGNVVGTPSDPVEINYGELLPEQSNFNYVNPADITPPESNLPEAIHPDIKITRYIPIQQQRDGAMYHFVVCKAIPSPWGGNMYNVGDLIDATPHEEDKSWFEKIGDFFSDIGSFVADAVNWVANAYESIKAFAVDTLVAALGEWARGPLTVGLEIGLAALGLPPSIPNFDELTSMGKDYLVKAAADYAGIPPEEAAKAVDIIIDEAKKASNGGGNPDIWLKPDPAWYYRPAYLELKVTNTASVPTQRVYASIHISVPQDEDEDLFNVPYAFIPTLMPGETITLPVFLEENTKNRMLDTGLYEGLKRFWHHYYTMPAQVSVYSLVGDKYKNPYKLTQTFQLNPCYQEHTYN